MVRRYFKLTHIKDNPFRVLNIGISIFSVLIAGYLLNNYRISSFASLGLFTFYYYQNISIKRLAKRFITIGFFLYVSFLLGALSVHYAWTSPLVVGFVAFFSRLTFRLRKNERPGAIFFAMLAAMGSSMKLPMKVIPIYSFYFVIGVLITLVIGLITKKLDSRPEIQYVKHTLKERFKVDPLSLMDAFFFSSSLFLTVYLSHSLNFKNPYWMTISCASVLTAENLDALKHRHIQYLCGSILGLLIASVLMSLNLEKIIIILFITLFYILSQYYIPRNYAIAQMFINPMVILLSSLLRNKFDPSIIATRFLGILCGSFLGLFIAWIMNYAIDEHTEIVRSEYIDKDDYDD